VLSQVSKSRPGHFHCGMKSNGLGSGVQGPGVLALLVPIHTSEGRRFCWRGQSVPCERPDAPAEDRHTDPLRRNRFHCRRDRIPSGRRKRSHGRGRSGRCSRGRLLHRHRRSCNAASAPARSFLFRCRSDRLSWCVPPHVDESIRGHDSRFPVGVMRLPRFGDAGWNSLPWKLAAAWENERESSLSAGESRETLCKMMFEFWLWKMSLMR